MGKRRPTHVSPPALPQTLHGVQPDHTVDLHGMRAFQAEQRVYGLLESWSRRESGTVLRVITGKGNRSADGPVLLTLVGDLLREDPRVKEVVLDAGGGGWLVRLR